MSNCSRSSDRGKNWGAFALVLCALMEPSGLRAQAWDPDTGEATAFGGGTFIGGSHAAVGASTGLAFAKYGMALIEVAFSPLGDQTVRHRTGPPVEGSRLYDFNTSFHIRIPVKERWAPYGIIGGGLLFDSFRAVYAGSGGLVVAVDEFNFGFHTGAGLRYYVRPDWGIRPEFKVIVSNRTYTRFTVGVFYNLPAGWPW